MTSADRSTRVLLAEDDDDMRDLIADRLREAGIEVVEIEDGFELRDYLDWCATDRRWPDVVVTDVRMPGENGLDVLLHAHFHRCPVVIITSSVTAEVRAFAPRLGVEAIFQKPFALTELLKTVQRLAAAP